MIGDYKRIRKIDSSWDNRPYVDEESFKTITFIISEENKRFGLRKLLSKWQRLFNAEMRNHGTP